MRRRRERRIDTGRGRESRRPLARRIGGWISCALMLLFGSIRVGSATQDDFADHRDPSTPLTISSPQLGVDGVDEAAVSNSGQVPAAQSSGNVIITYRITSGNALGLTVVNSGLFGNNFRSRSPSFEYPLGSNIDHLPRGGIWVGAVTAVGDTLVSTSCIDGAVSDVLPTSEFLPLPGTVIEERSLLPDSRYYDLRARSEQDFLYSCADTAEALLGQESNPDRHRPLKVQVNGETYLFSFDPFEACVIAKFRIINLSETDPLFHLRVGLYTELASGYKNPSVPNWTSGWFKKKALEYVDSLRLVMEHHYSLGEGRATSWAGTKLLGARPTPIDSLRTSFNWWNWDPSRQWRDAERYRILGNGEIDATSGIIPSVDDPVEVLSVSGLPDTPTAFDILEPGDTLTVGFAFIGGHDDREVSGRNARQDLMYNARFAQMAYDLDFRIPMPPPSPRLEVIPGHNEIVLGWSGQVPELFRDPKTRERDFEGYRVYVSEERVESGFRRLFERDARDGIGYDTDLADLRDSLIAPAETIRAESDPDSIIDIVPEIWHYRTTIRGLRDGFKYWVAVTAFDRGTADVHSLESGLGQNMAFSIPGAPAALHGIPKVTVFPNPYRGDAAWDGSLRRDRYLWFANLPPRCVIRIYTLAGDLVDTIDFDQATYRPIDIRGIYDPTDPRFPERDLPVLSGGMAAWDLVSRKDQGIASGLYLFSVEDRDSGDRQIGKFLVIK